MNENIKNEIKEVTSKNNYCNFEGGYKTIEEIQEYNKEKEIDEKIRSLFYRNYLEIHITEKHNDKMEYMKSVSTSCIDNELCKRYQNLKANTICKKCFSVKSQNFQVNIYNAIHRNFVLKEQYLSKEQIPAFYNTMYVRFEAFGDIANEIQLENYCRIALKNKETMFALWTKNYKVVMNYFKDHKLPKNMRLILSSLVINKPIRKEPFEKLGLKVSTFTVYDPEYVSKNHVNINCGGRKCIECKRCYKAFKKGVNDTMNELLK